jgi:hypothetical protein
MPREHQDAARTLAARVMGRPGVTSVRVGYRSGSQPPLPPAPPVPSRSSAWLVLAVTAMLLLLTVWWSLR